MATQLCSVTFPKCGLPILYKSSLPPRGSIFAGRIHCHLPWEKTFYIDPQVSFPLNPGYLAALQSSTRSLLSRG
jgi:hypothetical protein